MLTLSSKKTLRVLRDAVAIATIVVFVFLALISINSGVHMGMDETGMMAQCPFMIYQSTLCQMTIAEHIEYWQTIITGVIQYQGWVVAYLVLFFFPRSLFDFLFRQKWKWVLCLKYHFRPLWQECISRAFSDGILHSKIYQRFTV